MMNTYRWKECARAYFRVYNQIVIKSIHDLLKPVPVEKFRCNVGSKIKRLRIADMGFYSVNFEF